MKRSVGAGALALAMLAAPDAVAAQDRGWWDWALREVARTGAVDVERDEEARDRRSSRDPRSIGDIILGRRGEPARGPASSRRDRDDDDDDDDDDRWEADEDARGENGRRGPPFCRNGEGHPVHGLEWCREKGFGTGASGVIWQDRGWEDIVLRAPRDTDRRGGVVDQGGLMDVLGEVIFGRVKAERARLGGRDSLSGRWLRPRGAATVLQIRSGSMPIAELTDADGDGRVDVVLVPRR